MGKPIASVQLGVARFFAEVSDQNSDAELAAWVRGFARGLAFHRRGMNTYADELMDDVEDYRKAESDRKKARFGNSSGGIQRNPAESGGRSGIPNTVSHTDSQSVIQTDNKKKKRETSDSKRKHPFEKSPFFAPEAFALAFPDWDQRKRDFWHQAAVSYSGANGGRYLDWKLAIQNWERKDSQKGNHGTHKPTRADILNRDAAELLRDLQQEEGANRQVHPENLRVHASTRTGA